MIILGKFVTFKWIILCAVIAIFPMLIAEPPKTERKGAHVSVVGAGFSGLASALYLRRKGYDVTVFEKNSVAGGRAAVYKEKGFQFDIGPSWLWMPDVFEEFYRDFNYEPKYTMKRLDPSYSVYWHRTNASQYTSLADSVLERAELFESMEPGSRPKLLQFLKDSKWKYDVGMQEYVRRPGLSFMEMWDVPFKAPSLFLELLRSQRDYVAQFVDHPWLRVLLEWPVLFLGGSPADIPSLYSLMSWADWGLGTYYPLPGGMYAIADSLYDMAVQAGIEFHFDSEVTGFEMNDKGKITGIEVGEACTKTDAVVNSADYNYVEQNLLPKEYRRYGPEMWDKQVLAPAAYLYFLGFDRKLPNLEHHTFFFHDGMDDHLDMVYKSHQWPEDPVFYANVPSKTDPDSAPEDGEAIFILIPMSPNLHVSDDQEHRDYYLNHVLNRIGGLIDVDLHAHLVMNKSYAHLDFQSDYHAYKGNSFGLANTVMQTWMLKPMMTSLIENLVFVGQLTAPGPGVPPSLISGKMGADLIDSYIQSLSAISLFPLIISSFIVSFIFLILLSRMVGNTLDIDECYEICRRLNMSHGVSYYTSTLLLPKHLQDHVYALYGLTRTADEIVDDMTRNTEEMIKDLDAFEKDFFDSFDNAKKLKATGGGAGSITAKHPVNRAAVATAVHLNLKRGMFVRFFRSMRMDIEQPLYMQTMEECIDYMDGSAAVIGEFMLPALVGEEFYVHPEKYPDHDDLIRTARALGNAFQLTNFCRDVDEDLDRKRVYLPLKLLEKFNVSLEDLEKREMTPELEAAVEHCLTICDEWYKEAELGIELLAKYSDLAGSCIAASHKLYSGITHEIRKSDYAIFTKRCRVPMKDKLKILRGRLSFSIIPQIVEVITHHLWIRFTNGKPLVPPPIDWH